MHSTYSMVKTMHIGSAWKRHSEQSGYDPDPIVVILSDGRKALHRRKLNVHGTHPHLKNGTSPSVPGDARRKCTLSGLCLIYLPHQGFLPSQMSPSVRSFEQISAPLDQESPFSDEALGEFPAIRVPGV